MGSWGEYTTVRMEVFINICFVVIAYLVGAVPFGYIAGRVKGVDLREHGSRNIGATNAVRVLGKRVGSLVFVGDFLKGYLPLLAMKFHLGGDITVFSPEQMGWFLAVMFALVMGHTYTCYLNFRGGKGVATTAGALFALSPMVGGATLLTWLASMVATRYVSLSSLVAGVGMLGSAAYVFWARDGRFTAADMMVLGALFLIFSLVVAKHRSNIVRLCRGEEPKAFIKH